MSWISRSKLASIKYKERMNGYDTAVSDSRLLASNVGRIPLDWIKFLNKGCPVCGYSRGVHIAKWCGTRMYFEYDCGSTINLECNERPVLGINGVDHSEKHRSRGERFSVPEMIDQNEERGI